MANTVKIKCRIERYDPTCKRAPFKMLQLGEIEVEEDLDNTAGDYHYFLFRKACADAGYTFKFFSLSGARPTFKYDLTVA